jgi:hypothetical protein
MIKSFSKKKEGEFARRAEPDSIVIQGIQKVVLIKR